MPCCPRIPVALLLLLTLTGAGGLDAQTAAGGSSPGLDSVRSLANAGRPGAALALGRRLAEAESRDPGALAALAVGAMAAQNFDLAVQSADSAVGLAPEVSAWQLVAGQAYLSHARANPSLGAIGKVKKGRAAVERAIALDPDNLEARATLMQFLVQAPGFVGGSRDGARAQALEIERRDRPRGLLARLTVATAGGREEEVRRVFEDAVPLLAARTQADGFAQAFLDAAKRLKNRELREAMTSAVYAAVPGGQPLTP